MPWQLKKSWNDCIGKNADREIPPQKYENQGLFEKIVANTLFNDNLCYLCNSTSYLWYVKIYWRSFYRQLGSCSRTSGWHSLQSGEEMQDSELTDNIVRQKMPSTRHSFSINILFNCWLEWSKKKSFEPSDEERTTESCFRPKMPFSTLSITCLSVSGQTIRLIFNSSTRLENSLKSSSLNEQLSYCRFVWRGDLKSSLNNFLAKLLPVNPLTSSRLST